MAMLGSKRIHMVYTDSRGSGLQDLLDKKNVEGEYMEVVAHKSASFNDVASSAEEHLRLHPFDVVYIVGGATEVTSKNRVTKLISYNWKQNLDLQEHLVHILNQADKRLRKYYPASKVIFCPLVGTDLSRVVNAHQVSPDSR